MPYLLAVGLGALLWLPGLALTALILGRGLHPIEWVVWSVGLGFCVLFGVALVLHTASMFEGHYILAVEATVGVGALVGALVRHRLAR